VLSQTVINRLQPTAQLALAPQHALVLVGIAVMIALGSVLLVAWRPTHVRPLVVLREE
jgi:ABC-type lipoprotein release transport system permease subunit